MTTFIALESGATRTTAGLYNQKKGTLIKEVDGPPANPIELGIIHAADILVALIGKLNTDFCESIVAGVAGAGKGDLALKLAQSIAQATNIPHVSISNDIAPIFHANFPSGPGILVISGTGSSIMTRDASDSINLTGGHGALLGDRGSAYRLGLSGLEACAAALDGTGAETSLSERLFDHTTCTSIDQLILWGNRASKSDIAAIAPLIIKCAGNQDEVAADLVAAQAAFLADQTVMAKHSGQFDDNVPVLLYGGLLSRSEIFRTVYTEALRNLWPSAQPQLVTLTGHKAVAASRTQTFPSTKTATNSPEAKLPSTEQMAIAPKPIDTMTALEITEYMTDSNREVQRALRSAKDSIARTIDRAARAYQEGGRVIYIGAGTSGRLGVLDASECPPTFGAEQHRFLGLIAGGDHALRNSIEGAEDDRDQAIEDLKSLSPFPSKADIVIGITASGTTPYVLSALDYAASLGSGTALVACNPVSHPSAEIHIIIETGPEVLPGSTRLKAGTATKLVLNQISTGAMARCGQIYEGRMVGVKGVNDKLERRTLRITADLLNTTNDDAARALKEAHGDIKIAVLMRRKNLTLLEANETLTKSGGNLRDALES